MKIPLSMKIALQLNRKSGLVSLITVMGISIGVVVLIIGLSAMNGFERELRNRILAVVPHGEIEPVHPPFTHWDSVLDKIKTLPDIVSAAPYITFTALVENRNNTKTSIITVKAIHPTDPMWLHTFSPYVKDILWKNFESGQNQIIIGAGIANKLLIKPGDWLNIFITNHSHNQCNFLNMKRICLHVMGILNVGSQLDRMLTIMPLSDAQQYLRKGEDINGIAIKVNDIFHANQLVIHIGEIINASMNACIKVKVRSWIETYGYIYRDIKMIRAIIYLSMILLICIASFNIISMLLLAVKNKIEDIAILCTLGANATFIRTIFIWYGCLNGCIGGMIGVIFGILLSLNLTKVLQGIEYLLGQRLFTQDIYFIDFIPTELYWSDVLIIFIIVIVLSVVASWYPAKCASFIDPVIVLRNQ